MDTQRRLSLAPAAPAASPASPAPLPSEGRVPTSQESRVPAQEPPAAPLPANEATVGGQVTGRHQVPRVVEVEGRVPEPVQAEATQSVVQWKAECDTKGMSVFLCSIATSGATGGAASGAASGASSADHCQCTWCQQSGHGAVCHGQIEGQGNAAEGRVPG